MTDPTDATAEGHRDTPRTVELPPGEFDPRPQPEEHAAALAGQSLRETIKLRNVSMNGLFVMACIGAIYFGKPVLLPIVFALLLNFILRPIHEFLVRWRMPRLVASAVLLLGLLLVVAGAMYYLARPAAGWISELPPNMQRMEYKLRGLMQPVQQMSEVADQVNELTTMDNGKQWKPEVTVEGVELSDTMWSSIQSFAGYLLVVLILLFFMLAFGEHFFRRMDAEFSAGHMVRELGDSLSKYLLTITLINAGLGVAIGIAMFLWGMPTPVLWALIGMFMNYIPFLGAIAGVALAGFVGLLTFDSTLAQLGVPVTYFLLTSIEGNFITPTILGQRFTLNPIIIFIAILFWGWIWGIPGALMAVPLLVGFKIVCEHFPPLQRIGRLMNA